MDGTKRSVDAPSLSHDAVTCDLEIGLSKKVHAWICRRVNLSVVRARCDQSISAGLWVLSCPTMNVFRRL